MLSSEYVRGFPVALAATCSNVWYILVRISWYTVFIAILTCFYVYRYFDHPVTEIVFTA